MRRLLACPLLLTLIGSVCPTLKAQAAEEAAVNEPLPLPDSPGSVLRGTGAAETPFQSGDQTAPVPKKQRGKQKPEVCGAAARIPVSTPEAMAAEEVKTPCVATVNPYRTFLLQGDVAPLTPKEKGYMAFHDVIDPFNVLTILANSAFLVGIDSHSAYGPGMRGYGYNVGISFLQDGTGEFIGTFAVCSLIHQDPHYHRLVYGSIQKRMIHAISRTVIAQHDDGTPMPNYENFITYPASAEIANLYVPGIHGNGPSTAARILTGLATDPVNNIITEFLPDFARRVHIRIVFVQQILNQIATGQTMGGGGGL